MPGARRWALGQVNKLFRSLHSPPISIFNHENTINLYPWSQVGLGFQQGRLWDLGSHQPWKLLYSLPRLQSSGLFAQEYFWILNIPPVRNHEARGQVNTNHRILHDQTHSHKRGDWTA